MLFICGVLDGINNGLGMFKSMLSTWRQFGVIRVCGNSFLGALWVALFFLFLRNGELQDEMMVLPALDNIWVRFCSPPYWSLPKSWLSASFWIAMLSTQSCGEWDYAFGQLESFDSTRRSTKSEMNAQFAWQTSCLARRLVIHLLFIGAPNSQLCYICRFLDF